MISNPTPLGWFAISHPMIGKQSIVSSAIVCSIAGLATATVARGVRREHGLPNQLIERAHRRNQRVQAPPRREEGRR